MSLSFLFPAFLLGLAALAIPVLIHLSRNQRRDPIPFPSLMFLRRIPQQRDRRRRIHRWPLLLLRLAALLLLVFAFSRPYLQRTEETSASLALGSREVVVLVDRSYSMGLGDRWQRAVEEASRTIEGLTDGDRGTILFFDSGVEGTESTVDRGALRQALLAEQPGIRSTRYAPALRYAGRILASSPLPRHELVVISDFQAAGWDVDGAQSSSLGLRPGTAVRPVPVAGPDDGANVTVLDADLQRSVVAGRERVNVVARLSSFGAVGETVPVSLEIDGQVIENRVASFSEGPTTSVAFSPLTLPETGATRATIRVPPDALATDNALHFVLSADQRVGVLVVDGPSADPRAGFFIGRALAIGDAPGFRVRTRRPGEVTAADLEASAVVILNQAPLPGGEVGNRLRQHVERGGGLVMLLGDNPLGDWPGVLPSGGVPVDRSGSGGTPIGFIETSHPVFEAFAGPRSGDFASTRVYRYRSLPSGSFPRVLARFGDGAAALGERTVGEGRVLVWSTTFGTEANDLALQPIFLPFLHQLVKYAAGYAPPRIWNMVGDPLDPRAVVPPGEEYNLALTPSGVRIDIAEETPIELGEIGFYELRDARSPDRSMTIAVNHDPAEAEMIGFDPEELRTAVLAGTESAQLGAGTALTLAERERQQSGWWYLIIAAFGLLAAETYLSNRGTRGAGGGWLGRWRDGTPPGRGKSSLAGR